ncbi:hypothetical protein FBU59_007175 [Linderina macrospora]|uniref:Uncharacterized protein n=1 Tax=Linderina macrospora TaxID=4868 RepID=A0ACC1IXR0_9FUNG|nr:hypothetical protein FBU59_007175 [Linderina macrospora]
MLVPGRTNKSCRKRWFHSLDPSLHKGPWTPEEDSLLRERVSQFPAQWSRVAEGIQGRTDDQCAKRWRESLDPEIDRGKWRPEEDRLLLEKFAEFGTQWQKIATFFQGRPGLHCRNRWRKIQRIISQKERKTGPIPENDLNRTLAAVTESVNKRKTALRTRGPSSHPSRGTDSPPASSSSAVQFDAAQDASMEGLPGDQLASQQQEHQQQLDIQTSVSTAAGGMQSSQSGNTESIGAMYMPSEQQSAGTPATTPHFEGKFIILVHILSFFFCYAVLTNKEKKKEGRGLHTLPLFLCILDSIMSARERKLMWER